MNQEQVMKLLDDELRIKAAELLGMQNVRRGYDNLDAYLNLGGINKPPVNDMGSSYRLVGDIVDYTTRTVYVEDYPNDIAAAWVLESFLAKTYADGKVEDTRLHYGRSAIAPIGRAYQDAHPLARYIHALGDICSIDLGSIAYEDFGLVEYKNLFVLVHASPRDRTLAFILAMEPDDE